MVVSKKVIVLVVCVAALLTGLISSTGSTYAYNNIPAGEFAIGLTAIVGTDGKPENIKNDTATALYTQSTLWEPGAMHAADLTVKNLESGEFAFNYWLYPHIGSGDEKLGEVLDVYIYKAGAYDRAENGRPTLNESDGWLYLGTLDQLPITSNNGDHCLGSLKVGMSQTHTLLIKMQESAGNEYQGLSLNVNITMYAKQVTTTNS